MRIKAGESETRPESPAQDLICILVVVGDDVDDVEASLRASEQK